MKAIKNGKLYYEGKFQSEKVLLYSDKIESVLSKVHMRI